MEIKLHTFYRKREATGVQRLTHLFQWHKQKRKEIRVRTLAYMKKGDSKCI